MKRFKPLNILDNKGFWPEKAAIADAIKEVQALGGGRVPWPVRDYGRYRSPQWRDEKNNLVPWQSVDWYVFDSLDEERMQVDAVRVLQNLLSEPWRDERLIGEHYDLMVLQEDMYDSSLTGAAGPAPYVVGRARAMAAAVVSTHRIENIWGMPFSYVKTEVMRQLCFMFGIPSRSREDVAVIDGSVYCRNVCILRPAVQAPDDWTTLTVDRLRRGALCEPCRQDLKEFFAGAEREAASP